MSLRYCFETSYVRQTLNASKKSDLADIDSDEIKRGCFGQEICDGQTKKVKISQAKIIIQRLLGRTRI